MSKDIKLSFLFLILLSLSCNNKTIVKNNTRNSIELILGSCFREDTISITMNGYQVIKDEIISTNIKFGLVDYEIYCINKSIFVNGIEVQNNVDFGESIIFFVEKTKMINIALKKKSGRASTLF